MPAATKIEIVGVKDTIKELRRIDPEFRKQFNRDMKSALNPVVDSIRSKYPRLPLSGMAREWTPNLEKGYTIFPWDWSKVRRGVTLKTSTRKNKNSVVYISQANPAGILFETITLGNELGRNIRTVAPRAMWPTVDAMRGEINDAVGQIVVHVEGIVQGRIG
jgi:hypothetical protein